MKIAYLISILAVLPSCAWIATHPVEDAAIIEEGENIIKELYQYEMKRPLMPAPLPLTREADPIKPPLSNPGGI